MAHSFFRNEQFNFELQAALGQVAYGGGDVGELLSTADQIADDDFDSWVTEWRSTGARIEAVADACADAGHPVSARSAYLRAAHYHGLALAAVDGTGDPDALLLPTFRAHRRCFDAFASLLTPAVERIEIPYEDTPLPGYLFRPPGAEGRLPTLILNNGSDGPISGLWGLAAAAMARGYNALAFDGPGQQSMLFERGVPFRPDWEKVISPVIDHLLRLPGIDGSRLALYGISQAGYWVPRALAFERRVAAAVADPGVFDVATAWLDRVPPELMQLLDAGDRETFDHYVEMGMQEASAQERQILSWRAKPYGAESPFDTFTAVRQYTLEDVVHLISTPLLIADPEGEQFWPGQSRQLYDALSGPKRLESFTAAQGADRHCEPMARTLFEQRMFDWLDETLNVTSPRAAGGGRGEDRR